MTELTFYTKPGCHLCDEALETVERVRKEIDFDLKRIDISADSELADHYGELIPVVAVDGRIEFEYRVDAQRLRDLLASPAENPTNGMAGATR